MDNFRRYRSRSGKMTSIDGFIDTSKSRNTGRVQRIKSHQINSSHQSRIGKFNSTDGFHPVDISSRKVGLVDKPDSVFEDIKPSNHPYDQKLQKRANNSRILSTKHGRLRKTRHGFSQAKPSLKSRLKKFFIFNPFNRQNWTKKRVLANAMIAIFVVGGLFGAKAWWLANKIFQGGGGAVALQDNIDPSMLRGEGDGRVNILLLGRGGEGHDGADLTDTIVIASINPIQKEAALLSIPRDLYVQSGDGSYSKINAVFANAKNNSLANTSYSDNNRVGKAEDAGFKAVENVIQSKIGIPIHYHGIIDFEGFAKAIDTVKGVDINVSESATVYEPGMWIMGQHYTLNVQKGENHFNGLRALAYSRSRHTSSRGDFDRSERQRLIMVALKNKIFSAGTYSNPLKINQLMGDFGNHIRTNLGLDEVMRLQEIGKSIPSNKISSVGLADPPNEYVTTGMIYGQSVVYPKAGLDNYKEIQHFVRNRLRDGFLAHENATVAIYNGTEIVGLAGRTSDDLKSYGYNVDTVADSPTKGTPTTLVVDLRHGDKKYTKRYLENRFKTTAVSKIPKNYRINPGNADFVIILGQNEQTRLAD